MDFRVFKPNFHDQNLGLHMKKWEHLVFKQCEFQSIQYTLNETNDQRTFQFRCVHLQCEKEEDCAASMRAYAGLYFECLPF